MNKQCQNNPLESSIFYIEAVINNRNLNTIQFDIVHPELEIFELFDITPNKKNCYDVIIKLVFSKKITIEEAIDQLTINVDDQLEAIFDIDALYAPIKAQEALVSQQ